MDICLFNSSVVGAICQSSCCDKCYQQQVKSKHLWHATPSQGVYNGMVQGPADP